MAKQTNNKGKINRSGDDKKLPRRQGEYKKAASKKKKNIDKKCNDDWIASLAKDTLAKDNASSNNGNLIPSKEDRKRNREAKKNRRMEQKDLQQQQREQQQQPNLKKTARTTTTRRTPTSKSSSASVVELSKTRIRNLSQNLQNVYKDIVHKEKKEEHVTSNDKKNIPSRRTPYYLPGDVNANAIRNSVSTAKMRKRKLNEDTIQPRPCDYSGIGMARNSMLIEFVDPSYYPKLEEEFHEHIPGFFGKQRTKAMKKQTDGNMLWRRMANNKQGMSKKLKGMSPDERVESMIDSGLM
jgi:hypothetical protein